jgi:hypothetical protein
MQMPRIVYVIISIILMVTVGQAISTFFGIEFNTYGPYLLWFVAVALFYGILPAQRGSIFSTMSSS